MTEKVLPRMQIALMVLFSLSALFGSLVFGDLRVLLIFLLVIGLLVGGVTAAIGWCVLLQKKRITYPFSACSLAMFKRNITEGQGGAPSPMLGAASPMLGAANLALGCLVMLTMLAASTIFLP